MYQIEGEGHGGGGNAAARAEGHKVNPDDPCGSHRSIASVLLSHRVDVVLCGDKSLDLIHHARFYLVSIALTLPAIFNSQCPRSPPVPSRRRLSLLRLNLFLTVLETAQEPPSLRRRDPRTRMEPRVEVSALSGYVVFHP